MLDLILLDTLDTQNWFNIEKQRIFCKLLEKFSLSTKGSWLDLLYNGSYYLLPKNLLSPCWCRLKKENVKTMKELALRFMYPC